MLVMLQAIPSLAQSSTNFKDTQENKEVESYLSQVVAKMVPAGDKMQL